MMKVYLGFTVTNPLDDNNRNDVPKREQLLFSELTNAGLVFR